MIRRWLARLLLPKEKLKLTAEPELKPELDYFGYTMIDEQTGMTLSVLMVCGCGNPVVAAGSEDNNFWCEHCDRICTEEKPCQFCESHYLFDAEAVKAEAAQFRYDEDEDQEE